MCSRGLITVLLCTRCFSGSIFKGEVGIASLSDRLSRYSLARGDAGNRPVIDSTAPEDMKANRRVDVVVQSDESDAVKALIP
jgi:hypothetical protein